MVLPIPTAAVPNAQSNSMSHDISTSASPVATTSNTSDTNNNINSNNSNTIGGGRFMSNLMNNLKFNTRFRSYSTGDSGGEDNGLIRRISNRRRDNTLQGSYSSSLDDDLIEDEENNEEDNEENKKSYKIRFLPQLENDRSPNFFIINRQLKTGKMIKLGRYTDKSNNEQKLCGGGGDKHSLTINFRSKVVSRNHAEIKVDKDGKFYLRDCGSSSGTFLNYRRLSNSMKPSKFKEIKNGDYLQIGIDYQGGKDDVYRCIKIRVEIMNNELDVNEMIRKHDYNERVLNQVKDISGSYNSSTLNNKNDNEEEMKCVICLFEVKICQALFVAPCSHTFHYKCIRKLVNQHYPCFSCPVCRTFADLEEDDEEDDENLDEAERRQAMT